MSCQEGGFGGSSGYDAHSTTRSNRLLGIDSSMCPMEKRREVWQRITTDMKPSRLLSRAETGLADGWPRVYVVFGGPGPRIGELSAALVSPTATRSCDPDHREMGYEASLLQDAHENAHALGRVGRDRAGR